MTTDVATLSTLPGEARLWIFAADRPLDERSIAGLTRSLSDFLSGWAAHGDALSAGFELAYDRFLLVALDESVAAASGCSIDALVHHLKHLERELGVGLVDGSSVWFRGDDGVERVSRAEFQALAKSGAVDPSTVVFDLTVERLDDVRSGRWEVPASQSWHAALLGVQRS